MGGGDILTGAKDVEISPGSQFKYRIVEDMGESIIEPLHILIYRLAHSTTCLRKISSKYKKEVTNRRWISSF